MDISKNLTQVLRPISGIILKVLFAFLTMALLRMHFFCFNSEIFGEITSPEILDIVLGAFVFDSANVCCIFALFVILSVMPVSQSFEAKLWFKRTVMWSYLVGYFIVVVTNLADSVYFSFSRKRFTAEDFHFFDNSNTGDIVLTAMGEYWPLLIVIIVTMALAVFVYKKIDLLTQPRCRVYEPVYYITRVTLLLLSLFALIFGASGGLGDGAKLVKLNNAGHYTITSDKAAIVLCNPLCMLQTSGSQQVDEMVFFEDSTALKYFNPVITLPRDSLFGTQKGKNLVILVLESFSSQHSKLLHPEFYGDNEGFTPFLDSLMQQGYYYTRSYCNANKSFDALPAILSSTPPLGGPFSMLLPYSFNRNGMGYYFAQQGYETSFYNGSVKGSMGYAANSRRAGIKSVKSREDYEEARGTSDYDGHWGIWDEEFLQYYAHDLTTQYQNSNKPFFSTLFTVSSHHPFVLPERYKNSFHQLTDKHQACVEYTDMSLRKFFETASTQPWYDSTVFVLVADHDIRDLFDKRTIASKNQIIHFIYTPDGSLRGKHDKITQQINIRPTMYHLFGYEAPFTTFGRSDFDNPKPFAINADTGVYQWMEQDQVITLVDKQLKTVYNYNTDKECQYNLIDIVNISEYKQCTAFLQAYNSSLKRSKFKPKQ